MRPIRRNASPQNKDFKDYAAAQPYLISRLGSYCSYCERRIATQLAVEHIQPKGLPKYAHLSGRWDNFLLACVNCNSTKRDKDVVLSEVLLPDRDNTFAAYCYRQDGTVVVRNGLNSAVSSAAANTLKLVGLDKQGPLITDENGRAVAIDRYDQRMEAFLKAQEAKRLIDDDPANQSLRTIAVELAEASGFFSVWMTVFNGDLDMQQRLVGAFDGTAASGCFDPAKMTLVSPTPNPDGLAYGGKI
ncbi:MAG: HNH endonuclease [Candidatus Alcyoniella australis]|nr:HNH endonuclease [Candidatus Alcyoniella australis]